ncbi:uncharacterized protein LOC143595167 [Bidens hawaiensis]|uniref:uncharacterized protein LOC143595167 n=1 Tax=Bidens hawaiensis TaxID=980011 RepID=UPI00404ADFB5
MTSGELKEKDNTDDLSFVDFNPLNLNLDLLHKSNLAFDSASEYQLKPETKSIIHGQDSGAAEDLLNSMNNITDYDWLLSPPRHPVPSLEIEEQITLTDQTLISNGQSISLESKLGNPTTDVTSTTSVSSSNGVKPASTIRRPSLSRKAPLMGPTKPAGPIKRSTTPTPRPPILVKSASRSSTPIQRPSVTAAVKSASRPSTPIQRPSITASANVKSASRSSTPTQRPSVTVSAKSASRSSTPTPTQRPTATVSAKSASRSSTPTQQASVTASSKSASRSSTPTQRPSSAKSATRSSTPTQRPSATVTASAKSASRSSTPTQRPSVTTTAKSASRSSTPTQRPSVTVTAPAKSASRSSTPTLRSSNASSGGVKPGMTRGRGYSNWDDDVNPVLMGTQMVERVVNMRKLAPPREDHESDQDNASGKLSVSQNNSGFGRSLSKKSFDMALRHLDIRRSMPGNMRASITKVPASSVYSVRPESAKTRTISASESPLATSSSASSEDIHTTNH